MKKDKWLDGFRRRMENYSETVPEELWDSIEKDLKTVSAGVPWWKGWRIAAAILLLAIVSSLTVWFWHISPEQMMQQQQVSLVDVLPPVEEELLNPIDTEMVEQTMIQMTSKSVNRTLHQHSIIDATDSVEVVENKPKEETKEEEVPTHDKVWSNRSIKGQTLSVKKKDGAAWSLSLLAGNVFNSYSGRMNGYRHLSNQNLYDSGMEEDRVLLNQDNTTYQQVAHKETVNTEIKHHTPVSLGVMLRHSLNEKWSVETGLVYTLLASDLYAKGSGIQYTEKQELHYVGVPLRLNRNLWKNRRWNVYVSSGGMIEKCVSAKLEKDKMIFSGRTKHKEDLEVDEWQWSFSAALGAQFNVTKQVSVYAEPGVAYYWDDGSSVETIRKEKPFNLNLQIGIRMTISK